MANQSTVKFETVYGTIELSHDAYDTVANCYKVPLQFSTDVASALSGKQAVRALRKECARGALGSAIDGWDEYCDAVEATVDSLHEQGIA